MPKYAACIRRKDLKSDLSNILELPLSLHDRAEVDSKEYPNTEIEFLQLILYVQIVNKFNGEILSYARGAAGGESRLHGARSIGFGGHIDAIVPSGTVDTLVVETARELEEELGICITSELCSVIDEKLRGKEFYPFYITTTPVDKVHVCISMSIEIDPAAITALEKAVIVSPCWHSVSDLKKAVENADPYYEYWSQEVINNL